jgi:hypothetical protein
MSGGGVRVRFAPDVVLQVIDGEALVLQLGRESVFSLNETGARIAELLQQEARLEAVIARVAEEYAVDPSAVALEVHTLVERLEARQLVIVERGEDRR